MDKNRRDGGRYPPPGADTETGNRLAPARQSSMAESVQTVVAAWTWGSILSLALTTGFLTAAFNLGFAWLQRRYEDQRSGRVLALSLVESLTSYAQKCASLAQQNRFAKENGEYGSDKMPDFPPYEEQAAWGVLPPRLAGALRDLPNEVKEARRAVADTDTVHGPPEAMETATYQYIYLGHMALRIAEQLRRKYRLGPYVGRSTFAAELRQQYRKNKQGPIGRFRQSLFMARLRRRLRRWRL